MKIIGSMIWLLTGFLISKEINKSKREYLRRVEAFIELIKFIRLKIECFVTPIPDILRECDLDTIRICSGKDSAPSSIEKILPCVIVFGFDIFATPGVGMVKSVVDTCWIDTSVSNMCGIDKISISYVPAKYDTFSFIF